MKTWVAVVNRTEARLYETNDKNGVFDKKLKLVKRLENPKGRLKDQEINADRPGMYSGGFSYGRGSRINPQSPTDRVAQIFAKSISEELDRASNEHLFEQLILVSEPNFLGKVRAALSKKTANAVCGTLRKDLIHVSDHELPHLLWPKSSVREVELRP
ncbi:MAG: host attachment protein [Bdellovibrionales bacterium]|nr:host attachment protein [Bdellovibrionales bacterium]